MPLETSVMQDIDNPADEEGNLEDSLISLNQQETAEATQTIESSTQERTKIMQETLEIAGSLFQEISTELTELVNYFTENFSNISDLFQGGGNPIENFTQHWNMMNNPALKKTRISPQDLRLGNIYIGSPTSGVNTTTMKNQLARYGRTQVINISNGSFPSLLNPESNLLEDLTHTYRLYSRLPNQFAILSDNPEDAALLACLLHKVDNPNMNAAALISSVAPGFTSDAFSSRLQLILGNMNSDTINQIRAASRRSSTTAVTSSERADPGTIPDSTPEPEASTEEQSETPEDADADETERVSALSSEVSHISEDVASNVEGVLA